MKIDAEQHFNATLQKVTSILDNYCLTPERYEPAKTGVENTTLLLTSEAGKFALRVYRQNKKDDLAIENEIAFINYLRQQSLPIAEIIPASDGNQLTHTGINGVTWQAILMEFLNGRCATEYDPALVDNMADLQARLHSISQTYPASHQAAMQVLRDQPFVGSIDRSVLPDQKLAQFLDRAMRHEVTLPEHLPAGWCHLDLDKGNLLVDDQNEIIGVLDFDDAANVAFVVDLAYAMWAVSYFGDERLAKKYLARYEKTRLLSEAESFYLPRIMLYRHYVVSSMFINNNPYDDSNIDKYLAIEQLLFESIDQSNLGS